MGKKRLTEESVQRLRPPAKGRVELGDAVVPGLVFRASSTGAKSWALLYRIAGQGGETATGQPKRGPLQRLTLGKYPVLDLKAARDQARDALALADRGIDPTVERAGQVAERRVARANTVSAVVADFVAKHAKVKTRNGAQTERVFALHVEPEWGTRPIAEIRRKDAVALLDTVAAKSGPYAAASTLKVCRTMWNWCLPRELVEVNPFDKLRPPRELASRERVLTAQEIGLVWRGAGKLGYPFRDFIWLLLLTGQRRNEIACLQRGWLHLEDAPPNFEIPREQYKGRRAHVVPLSGKALEIVAGLPEYVGGGCVLSTRGGLRPISGFSKAKRALDKEILKLLREADPNAKPLAPWRLHDIRRTVTTRMRQLGIDRFTVQRVIGHAMPSLESTYDRHDYLDEKHAALEQWAAELAKIAASADGTNVVRLEAAQ